MPDDDMMMLMSYDDDDDDFHPINLQHSSYKHVSTRGVVNSVDPDQQASQKPVDLGLHCFQSRIYPD